MFAKPPQIIRSIAIASALFAAAACADRQNAARADSDLAHDLALAGQVNAQPTLTDTASAAPVAEPKRTDRPARTPDRKSPERAPVPQPTQVAAAPQAVAPVPVPQPVVAPPAAAAVASAPAPAPVPKVIGTGSGVALSSGMKLCTATNKVGDKITASVASTVNGSGGAAIPAGSRVVLEVTQIQAGDSPESSSILLRATSVYIDGTSYPVSGDVTTTSPLEKVDAPSTGLSDKQKVIGGAVAGAIIGQLLGHSTKGTVIGGAAGAATGAAVAGAQRNHQACLPEGAQLKLTLGSPLTIN